jgi:hypothetical protein
VGEIDSSPRSLTSPFGDLNQQLLGTAKSGHRVGITEGTRRVASEREHKGGPLRRPSHLILILEWANSSQDEDAKPWAHRDRVSSRGVARLPNGWLAMAARPFHSMGLVRQFSNADVFDYR